LFHNREYRVMLSGTGGDEMNGQPLDPRIVMADSLVHLRFPTLAKELLDWSLLLRRPLIQLLCETAVQLLPLRMRAHLSDAGKLELWVNRDFARRHQISARQIEDVQAHSFWRPRQRDAVQTIATLGRQLTHTRPSCFEMRYPYLDQDLVEFLTTIPFNQLLRPGKKRFLMRRALADLLPPEILSRQTKAGAARCYPRTIEKHCKHIEQLCLEPYVSAMGYVDRDRFREALIRLKAGQVSQYFLRLLKVLSLECWLRHTASLGVISVPDGLSSPASDAQRFPPRRSATCFP
jgi:asparagine synthase (glutamine-hydrolysing)